MKTRIVVAVVGTKMVEIDRVAANGENYNFFFVSRETTVLDVLEKFRGPSRWKRSELHDYNIPIGVNVVPSNDHRPDILIIRGS